MSSGEEVIVFGCEDRQVTRARQKFVWKSHYVGYRWCASTLQSI
jgi:hypothetical protein